MSILIKIDKNMMFTTRHNTKTSVKNQNRLKTQFKAFKSTLVERRQKHHKIINNANLSHFKRLFSKKPKILAQF